MSDHDIWIFTLTLSTYLLKTKFKIDKKFNVKGMQNKGIWNHTAKGYWKKKARFKLALF